jgi:hypothetical protein
MNTRAASWLAWSMCALCLSLMAFTLLLIFLGWSTPLPRGWSPWRDQAISLIGFIGAPILGGLIASRRPENPYGWLWLGSELRPRGACRALRRLRFGGGARFTARPPIGQPGARLGMGDDGHLDPLRPTVVPDGTAAL